MGDQPLAGWMMALMIRTSPRARLGRLPGSMWQRVWFLVARVAACKRPKRGQRFAQWMMIMPKKG
jgi:hypothetical protein